MSIRTRLIGGISLLLLAVVALAIMASIQVRQLAQVSDQIASRSMRRVAYMSQMNTLLVQWRGLGLSILLSNNPQTKEEDLQSLNNQVNDIEDLAHQYGEVIEGPMRRADYEAFLEHITDYLAIHRHLESLLLEGELEEAKGVFASSQGPFDEMLFHIGRIRDEEMASAREASQAAVATVGRTQYLFLISTLAVMAIQLGLGLYIWRSLSSGLQRLLAGTKRVAQGDLSQPVTPLGRDEFASLATAFNAMVSSLKQSQEENQRLTQEALNLQEERINLLQNQFSLVIKAQEEERKRVARELHDDTAQALVTLSQDIDSFTRQHKRLSPRLKEELGQFHGRVNETLHGLRRFSQDLRPSIIDDLGLLPALEWLAERSTTQDKVKTTLVVKGTPCRPRPEVELNLFRIAQEALRNTAKHAKASEATIGFDFGDSQIRLAISDNGIGFEPPSSVEETALQGKLGLLGIQERARQIQGTLEIRSQPNQGTTVLVDIPRDICCPPEETRETI